jgi:hypothetical protein
MIAEEKQLLHCGFHPFFCPCVDPLAIRDPFLLVTIPGNLKGEREIQRRTAHARPRATPTWASLVGPDEISDFSIASVAVTMPDTVIGVVQ